MICQENAAQSNLKAELWHLGCLGFVDRFTAHVANTDHLSTGTALYVDAC